MTDEYNEGPAAADDGEQEQDQAAQPADQEGSQEPSSDEAVEDAEEQVQEVVDEETDKGFRGTETDFTPNEAYTVQGVGANPDGVPEAAKYKVEAQLEATNPDLRARH